MGTFSINFSESGTGCNFTAKLVIKNVNTDADILVLRSPSIMSANYVAPTSVSGGCQWIYVKPTTQNQGSEKYINGYNIVVNYSNGTSDTITNVSSSTQTYLTIKNASIDSITVTAQISSTPSPSVYSLTLAVIDGIGGTIQFSQYYDQGGQVYPKQDVGTSWVGTSYNGNNFDGSHGVVVTPSASQGYHFDGYYDANMVQVSTPQEWYPQWALFPQGTDYVYYLKFSPDFNTNKYSGGSWSKSGHIKVYNSQTSSWEDYPVHIYRNGQWEDL